MDPSDAATEASRRDAFLEIAKELKATASLAQGLRRDIEQQRHNALSTVGELENTVDTLQDLYEETPTDANRLMLEQAQVDLGEAQNDLEDLTQQSQVIAGFEIDATGGMQAAVVEVGNAVMRGARASLGDAAFARPAEGLALIVLAMSGDDASQTALGDTAESLMWLVSNLDQLPSAMAASVTDALEQAQAAYEAGNFEEAGEIAGQLQIQLLATINTGVGVSEAVVAAGKKLIRTADIDTTTDTPAGTLNPGETDIEAGGLSYYDQFKKADGSGWDWPDNFGFASTPAEAILPIGTRIDRYGSPKGAFMSPEGTPFEQRAMAPGSKSETLYVYELKKELPIIQGEVAPAFDQPGGGVQILPNLGEKVNVQWLIDNGYLKRVN
ncbi:hypothetical protein COO92_13440 [Thalassospira lohafexi]|uniref:TNT domain-containing protein n=2 Tax=Thalassospira lohafexi TaxID=744227 RepID=A0A2N3L5B2_9PROT|nr:hypothetical protein COO92_13440 [Thalassospira lohafexi]